MCVNFNTKFTTNFLRHTKLADHLLITFRIADMSWRRAVLRIRILQDLARNGNHTCTSILFTAHANSFH